MVVGGWILIGRERGKLIQNSTAIAVDFEPFSICCSLILLFLLVAPFLSKQYALTNFYGVFLMILEIEACFN
jgi:hypothetical protein